MAQSIARKNQAALRAMKPTIKLFPAQSSPFRWFYFAVSVLQILLIHAQVQGQTRLTPVHTAYSALSAGIGTLWLTHEDNYFKKHELESSLIYIRGGTTAVQALLAGEIQFGHLSPAPMLTAWAQGADFVWLGTTTNQMVFTLFADPAIAKGGELKSKKIASLASVQRAIWRCARLWSSSASALKK